MTDEEPNIIQDHPEFPFGDTLARERLDRWEESFDRRPEPEEPAAALLQEFLEFVERYAFLERIVQGEIRYELPVHPRFLQQRELTDDPLEQQAAELAEAEAELLAQPEVPAIGLFDEAEDIGIKVLTTSRPASTELVASFFFEGETGPAFLVGSDRDDPRAVFALAHLLGHYVADHDPYQNRVCRWDPQTLENIDENPAEVRADLFARALLVPEEPLRRYLDQLGEAISTGETKAEASWEILSTLFGVPESVLVDRMGDLGFEALATQLRLAGQSRDPETGTGVGGGGDEAGDARGHDGGDDVHAHGGGLGKAQDDGPGPDPDPGQAGAPGEGDSSDEFRDGTTEDDIVARRKATIGQMASGPEHESNLRIATEGAFLLPHRYMNLALACYHERIMEKDVLGQFLGMSEMEIEAVLQWSQVGRRPPGDPGGEDEDDGPETTIH